jgi:hypothetical protein
VNSLPTMSSMSMSEPSSDAGVSGMTDVLGRAAEIKCCLCES